MISYFPIVTGSLTVAGNVNITGAITASGGIAISGSIASASYAQTATSASYAAVATSATTASFANNFTVTGNLTAQTLVVQTITSSVDFVTGSTRFGTVSGNTHQFTGSVSVSGSMQFSNSSTITTNAGTGFLAMYANGGGLYFGGAASTNHMMISSSGNIGIGTTTPYQLLDVAGNIRVGNQLDNTSRYVGKASSAGTWRNYIRFISSDTEDYITFGTHLSGTSSDERMRITPIGNIAIGSSIATGQASDNRVIQIYGAGTANRAQIHLCNSNTGEGTSDGTFIGVDSSTNLYINNAENAATIFENNGAESMRINANKMVQAPFLTGKSYAETSGGGTGTSIIDTGIYYSSGDNGGYGPASCYLVTLRANPNAGGSGAYYSSLVGYVLTYTGWNGSAVTVYTAYTALAAGNGGGNLTIYPTFWNGSTESNAVNNSVISSYQLRIKVSGYNSSYTGNSQSFYMTKLS